MADTPRTYFDYNASAPLLDCARDAMVETLGETGNASSIHFEGRNARKRVESARQSLADLVGCDSANIVFTSGATEAANYALSPYLRGGGHEIPVSKLYVSATEHDCILAGGRFDAENIVAIPVTPSGIVDMDALGGLLEAHDEEISTFIIAIQLANNETGIIQPIKDIADIVHELNGYLVVDAVQALGKIPFTMEDTGADFIIVSSHKIGGPQGAGALILQNPSLSPTPMLRGGGQENYHRGGTENVASIAGFGAACEWHKQNLTQKVQISQLRDFIEDGIATISQSKGNKIGTPIFFGRAEKRLDNTSCFSVPGIKAETALMALDLDGISLSSGSACSSGKVKGSHVLEAMGAEQEEIEGALRLSLGWKPDEAGAERFLKAWDKLANRLAA